MPDSQTRSAAFVRGFFTFLESQKVRSAVLHGGEDGFERELSDVDFAVDAETFANLPKLIWDHCGASGWLLCQILRHETTAAYFVCTDANNPACSIALDACSDYQRNGTTFIRSEDLLENRRLLPWGGYGLPAAMELRYRFAKAAAKHKDSGAAALEFQAYPEEARLDCEAWLAERWGIPPTSWGAADLATAFATIRDKSNPRPSLTQPGAASRIISRILHPTGLVVIASHGDYDACSDSLERAFGHLHFRRFRKAANWQPGMLRDLISSTLIVVPEMNPIWRRILPVDCVHVADPVSPDNELAVWLHERCKRRDSI